MYIRRSSVWRIAIFISAALAVAITFAITNYVKLKDYTTSSNMSDRRSFAQLCEAVSSIDNELSRSAYATKSATQLFRISNEISKHTEAAKTALAALPSSELGLDRTSEFLTLASDYCSALALKSATGTELTDEDIKGLNTLRKSSSALSNELNSLYARSENKDFFAELSKEKENTEAEIVNFALGMSFAEENMPESPVLIYDGPYSSHITQQKAAFLGYADKEITVVEGIGIVADFLGLDKTGVKYICKTDGDVLTYTYADTSEQTYVTLTVSGGNVVTLTQNSEIETITITGEDAVTLGKEYLNLKGYKDLTPSYHYINNGICYINYHHKQNDTTVYPDLIQLGIRLDTGETTYMNAYGYLWNHREDREISPKLTSEEVIKNFDPQTTEYSGLCIIPSDGKNELLCHEIKGTDENGIHFLIYVNDENSNVEKIFVLVEDENGTLTV